MTRAPYVLRLLSAMVTIATWSGMLLLAVETIWVTYGVFARYVLGSPDRMVTEATALLLVPLAFVGLPYAFRADAIPRVNIFVDMLSPRLRRYVQHFNTLLLTLVGAFFTHMAVMASIRTYRSGVTSFVIAWPEYLFWIAVGFSFGLFTLCALVTLTFGLLDSEGTKN